MSMHDAPRPQEQPPPEDEDKRDNWATDLAGDMAGAGFGELIVWAITLPFRALAWLVGAVFTALG